MILILILISEAFGIQSRFTQDCFVPDLKAQGIFHNCYNGVKFQLVKSQGTTARTSFYISSFPISREEYFHFLKDRRVRPKKALKALNPARQGRAVLGITWNEARDYCQAFGHSLPSEDQWEAADLENFASELEWTADYFSRSKQARRVNPGHLRSVRSSRDGIRLGRSAFLRNPRLGFRCVSTPASSTPLEVLLNHSQERPTADGSNQHFLRLETFPSGAKIYLDPQLQHRLGRSPFFGTLDKKTTTVILKKRGYYPKTLRLETPPGKGQRLAIQLKKLPKDHWRDPRRQISMTLVPGGRQNLGLGPLKAAKVQRQILKQRRNHDLSAETVRQYLKPEAEQNQVFVKDFYMDQVEVTNAQYLSYAKKASRPKSRCWNVNRLARPNQPVACVNWLEARDFCQFFGLDLPTEVQFIRASSNTQENPKTQWKRTPQNAGREKQDISRYGIHDLGGNLSEWTLDWYDPQTYAQIRFFNPKPSSLIREEKVIRGGSFASHRLDNRLSKRRHKHPHHFALDLGFRCVKNNLGDRNEKL